MPSANAPPSCPLRAKAQIAGTCLPAAICLGLLAGARPGAARPGPAPPPSAAAERAASPGAVPLRRPVQSVIDFGADPTGVADSLAAFDAAAASAPVGTDVLIRVPRGAYRMSGTFTGNGRIATVVEDAGVSFSGTTTPLYVTRIESTAGSRRIQNTTGQGSPTSVMPIGPVEYIVNNGNNAAIGSYESYINVSTFAANRNGGDIGHQHFSSWPAMSGTGLMGTWDVTVSPLFNQADASAGRSFGLTSEEFNPVNNGPDATGWTEFDSTKSGRSTGVPAMHAAGPQIVPDIWAPSGGYGGNIHFGLGLFESSAINRRPSVSSVAHVPTASAPYHPRSYTGLLIGNRAIAPGGRGIYVGGNTEGIAGNEGYTPLESRYAWQSGIHLELATFDDNQAINMAAGHTLAWGPTGAATVKLGISGTALQVNGAALALASSVTAEASRARGTEALLAPLASPAFTGQMTLDGGLLVSGALQGDGADLAVGSTGPGGTGLRRKGAEADQSGGTVVAANGGTDRYPLNASERFLDPAAGIAGFTEMLPASPPDGLIVHISCGQTIATLNIVSNAGQRLRPATTGTGQLVATSCSPAQGRQFRWHDAASAWTQDY